EEDRLRPSRLENGDPCLPQAAALRCVVVLGEGAGEGPRVGVLESAQRTQLVDPRVLVGPGVEDAALEIDPPILPHRPAPRMSHPSRKLRMSVRSHDLDALSTASPRR